MIEHFGRCPTPMGQVLLEHFHGAATRVGITDTAFPHRSLGSTLIFGVQLKWPTLSPGKRELSWVRAARDDALREIAT